MIRTGLPTVPAHQFDAEVRREPDTLPLALWSQDSTLSIGSYRSSGSVAVRIGVS